MKMVSGAVIAIWNGLYLFYCQGCGCARSNELCGVVFLYFHSGFALRLAEVSQISALLRRFVMWVAYVLVAVLLVQNVTIANTAYVKKELDADATLSTMTRVADQLEQREDYVLGETPVAFIGAN